MTTKISITALLKEKAVETIGMMGQGETLAVIANTPFVISTTCLTKEAGKQGGYCFLGNMEHAGEKYFLYQRIKKAV